MKLLKKRAFNVIISIIVISFILLLLFILLFDDMSAKITNISISENNSVSIIQDKDNEESIIFDVNISGPDYFFSSSNILFLNKDNKIIKANELVNGDQIYILKLNWIERDLLSIPPEIQNILLVKKLN